MSKRRTIVPPDVDVPPMPSIVPPGTILNGRPIASFGAIDSSRGYPDVRSFQRKLGLLVPATNTSMEHELWSIVFKNQGPAQLAGVGLHTTTVATPKTSFGTPEQLADYKRQFLGGLKLATDQALAAQPHYLIIGMSLEHIIAGLDEIRAPIAELEAYAGIACGTWHEAVHAALAAFGARRIGLLTPFDTAGNANAVRLFADLGYDVVASVGFACANALHIAHIPDWAKEKAIIELLCTPRNQLDAIVQCGTNMSMSQVSEHLEPVVGIPILGINSTTFWHALRENGIVAPLEGGGRLLREF